MSMHDHRLTAAHREYGSKDAAGERADDKAELKSVMDALAERDGKIKEFAEKAQAEITLPAAPQGRRLSCVYGALRACPRRPRLG